MGVLTADGYKETVGVIPSDNCCPVPICQVDFCGLACSFVNLLPSGPMWDRPKKEALDYYRAGNAQSVCDFTCPPDELTCQTLVAYSTYLSRILLDLIYNALAPNLRESNPYTASAASLDDWLERLGWQDCYATQCRSITLGALTPYEVMGECGPIFCPPPAKTPELECAIKRGIVIALTRANMGVVKTIAGINWIIEPLGAALSAIPSQVAIVPPNCKPCDLSFSLCNVGDTIPACDPNGECSPRALSPVKAYIDRSVCDQIAGLPNRIWPGVLAAECIVRSLMPATCTNNIIRCC